MFDSFGRRDETWRVISDEEFYDTRRREELMRNGEIKTQVDKGSRCDWLTKGMWRKNVNFASEILRYCYEVRRTMKKWGANECLKNPAPSPGAGVGQDLLGCVQLSHLSFLRELKRRKKEPLMEEKRRRKENSPDRSSGSSTGHPMSVVPGATTATGKAVNGSKSIGNITSSIIWQIQKVIESWIG